MSNSWFCRIGNDELGPYTAQEVLQMAREGHLSPHDWLRNGEDGVWRRADQVKGILFPGQVVTAEVVAMSTPPPRTPSTSPQRANPITQIRVKPTWLIAGGVFGIFAFLVLVVGLGEYRTSQAAKAQQQIDYQRSQQQQADAVLQQMLGGSQPRPGYRNPFDRSQDPRMLCPQCGTSVPVWATVCPGCKAALQPRMR